MCSIYSRNLYSNLMLKIETVCLEYIFLSYVFFKHSQLHIISEYVNIHKEKTKRILKMVIGTLRAPFPPVKTSSVSFSLKTSSLRRSLQKVNVFELEQNQEPPQFTVTFVCRSLTAHHDRAGALAGIHTLRSPPSICQPGGSPPRLLNASSLFSELNIV